MESFFSRYRNLLVLLVVLVAQLLGLAMQVRRADSHASEGDGKSVRLIRLWASAVVGPPENFIHWVKMGAVGAWQDYVDLHNVREQNKDLLKTVDRMRLEEAQLLEDARQGQRLQALLDFQQKYLYKTVAAQAIGSSGSDHSKVFLIDKGADAHLEPDMAVITADGIVGKVREVFPHTAQVLAINDQTSGAGVVLESTRLRGILRGNAFGQLQVVGILADQRIKPGERVVTAGGDMIFPRGLSVGVVDKVVRDPERDSFVDILIKPAAHIDQLDEVMVITAVEPRMPPEQLADLAQSEKEKGPVLAAMKEEAARQEAARQQALKEQQEKAAEALAARLPGLTDPNQPKDGQLPEGDPNTPKTPGPTRATPALHPDRFSPGSAAGAAVAPRPVVPAPSAKPALPGAAGAKTPATGSAKPATSGGATSGAAKPGVAKPALSGARSAATGVSGATHPAGTATGMRPAAKPATAATTERN